MQVLTNLHTGIQHAVGLQYIHIGRCVYLCIVNLGFLLQNNTSILQLFVGLSYKAVVGVPLSIHNWSACSNSRRPLLLCRLVSSCGEDATLISV